MKVTTFQLSLGLVVVANLELLQLDVKMVFLHGNLDKEVYHPIRNVQSLDLKKTLYGLK